MIYDSLFEKIDSLKEAIDRGEPIKIKYINPNKDDEKTTRYVIPVKLTDGHNVLAFCGTKKEYRKFSVENIEWIDYHRVLH